jgi:hypothetical protein
MTTKVGAEYPDCEGMPLLDKTGRCVEIDVSNGMVKVDGFPVFRLISTANGAILQFADSSKYRSRSRGTRYIEIPASVLFKKLINSSS